MGIAGARLTKANARAAQDLWPVRRPALACCGGRGRAARRRHGAASMLRAETVEVKVISEILGHASTSFTGDVHTVVARSRPRRRSPPSCPGRPAGQAHDG